MKIIYTQEDVERIVLEYTERVHSAELNHVRISHYYSDYCTVEWRDPAPEIAVEPLTPEEEA